LGNVLTTEVTKGLGVKVFCLCVLCGCKETHPCPFPSLREGDVVINIWVEL